MVVAIGCLMKPSHQNPSWILSTSKVFLILVLHISHTTGVGGANLTVVNQCSETIWAVVGDASATAGKEVRVNSSLTFPQPDGWGGRVWSKTGCIFNESGSGSCATGDTAAVTLAEFELWQSGSSLQGDYYDVSLVNGFNLPLVVKPIGGSGSCRTTGCTEDLNKRCPAVLRTVNGAACQGPCTVFGTAEYCCTGTAPCGPTAYSRLFKEMCPTAYSYPKDDASSIFICGAGADYTITFCPPHDSLLEEMAPAPSPSYPPSPAPTPATATTKNNPQQKEENNNAKEIIAIVSLIIGGAIVIIVSIIIFCFLKTRHSQKSLLLHCVSKHDILKIVSGCVSGVIVVSVIIYCFLKRRNSHKLKCNQDVENLLLQHGSLAPKRYRYSEIKKITKSLNDKLGRGGYGSVYKGVLTDGRLVAVKILIETDSNGEEFINEVVSISRTSHVNIVKLLGFCYEGEKRALVYEFMPNKSLDMFLGGNGNWFLDLKKRYVIAVGVAKGLEYLHTGCTTRIVHFDIKPQNILLDEELCPKISDFGLAKLCKKKQSILSVLGTRGTIGYIAPEVFSRNFGGVSHKSDVYSYGMMLLEMAGAKEIVGNGAIQSSENYFPDKIYEQMIIHDVANNVDELAIEEEEEARKKMFMVGFWCIQTIPSERPSISKVVEMLEGSVESIQIPPKPVLFHRPLNTDLDHPSSFVIVNKTNCPDQDTSFNVSEDKLSGPR